jgi:hypothetical protein
MRQYVIASAMLAGLAFSWSTFAQTPAVTATCKDGTAFSGAARSGACRGHKGVQSWGDATAPSSTTTPATTTSPSTTNPVPAQATHSVPGNGQVWVNTQSKVYHCPDDRDYGHTKQGTYMTEAAAKAEGDRPSRGKVCS